MPTRAQGDAASATSTSQLIDSRCILRKQNVELVFHENRFAASIGRDVSYINPDGEVCTAQNLVDDYEKKLRSSSNTNSNSSSSNPPLENKFSSLCVSLPEEKKG
uniref:Uncharacterized protein n=1 Tax=Trichogramma kaykai TaxID=54128 RepID=A0ABD2WSC8_9HYME